MRYAQFFTMSTGYVEGSIPPRFNGPKKPIEALGSDGVLRIDGRLSLNRAIDIAAKACVKRGYVGFSLHRGEAYSRSSEERPFSYS